MSWQQPQGGGPPQQQSGAAIAALILGICGFVVCPFVCSVAAVVLAQRAYDDIDRSGGRLTGRGLAQAGQVLGYIGLALCVLGLLLLGALVYFGSGYSLV